MTPSAQHPQVAQGDASVRVHSIPTLKALARESVYFTFASGSLSYDCVSCGARCCRGFGYELVGAQLLYQLKVRPALELFLDADLPTTSPGFHVGNCPPACFFLSQDGRCQVHVEAGYAYKPETCRLFPFNRIRLVDGFLIVSPHPGLCPLQVTEGGVGSPHSFHETLFDGLAAQGLHEAVPRGTCVSGPVEEVVLLERRIVNLVPEYLASGSVTGFVAAQIRATIRPVFGPPPAGPWDDADSSVRSAQIAMSEVLETGKPSAGADDPHVGRSIIAMTPTFRAELLFQEREQGNDRHPLELERVPYFMLALSLVASQARAAGIQDVSPQTLIRLFQQFRPLLHLLANANRVVAWDEALSLPIFNSGDKGIDAVILRVSRELLPSQQRKKPRTLSEIILANLDDVHGPRRIVTLKAIAKRLEGRISGRFLDGQEWAKQRSSWRHRLQRWTLANAPEAVLLKTMAARNGHAGRTV